MDVEAELPLLQVSCKSDRAGSRGRRARENRRRSLRTNPSAAIQSRDHGREGRDPLRRRSCSEANALTAREVRASSVPRSTTRLFRLLWLVWRAAQWRDGPHAHRMVGETIAKISFSRAARHFDPWSSR
jgi:hypothetical protein